MRAARWLLTGIAIVSGCTSTAKTHVVEHEAGFDGTAAAAGLVSSGGAGASGGSSGAAGIGGVGAAGAARIDAAGGAAGSGGTSGAGGTADGSADEPDAAPPCPALHGATMLLVDGFCIDPTEVTNADYAEFLDAGVAAQASAECGWNASYVPASGWPTSGEDTHPVVRVDWCDAVAYCAWAGKRLCGARGGGPNPFGQWALASSSQWFDACSAGGTKIYPYGDTYQGGACNSDAYGVGTTIAVGSAPLCVGGYASLHDLSGNVYEWEDSCSGGARSSACRTRGGSYVHVLLGSNLRCDNDYAIARDGTLPDLGFRCCGP